MAVPFFVPEEPKSESTSTSTVQLTTNSATNLNDQSSAISNVPTSQPQTPHTSSSNSSSDPMNSSSTLSPNPANNEYLVQAFCDALHRFSLDRG